MEKIIEANEEMLLALQTSNKYDREFLEWESPEYLEDGGIIVPFSWFSFSSEGGDNSRHYGRVSIGGGKVLKEIW